MLTELHIENFALIQDLNITFKDKMNVIIGETGSGKSILMSAIFLLTGGKSDFDKIRHNKEKAFIEGVFVVDNETNLSYLKDNYSDYIDDNTFIISRTLDIKGKSTSRLNGRVVPISLIKDIMVNMVDIHSSSSTSFFFDEKKQLSILDNFIKNNASFNSDDNDIYLNYEKVYKDYVLINNKIKELNEIINDDIDMDYINYQINELKSASLKENEMEDLEIELHSLNNIVSLSEKMEQFSSYSNDASSLLFKAKRILDTIKDESFSSLKEEYIDAYYTLEETSNNLFSSFNDILNKASSISTLKDRLTYLHSLKRKYGSSTSDMINKLKELELVLERKENAEYDLKKALIKENEIKTELFKIDEELLTLRKRYALLLQDALDKELDDLLFNTASFKVEFFNLDSIKEYGIHNVIFKLKANEGMEYMSLKDTASLGESSRLLLALKKVFFDYSFKETLIFDEIDIGISGKAALCVGKKIKELSINTQVLCISHLGQVSIQGDHFFKVEKEVIDNDTITSVKEISNEEGLIEISKMVSGDPTLNTSLDLVKSWK